MRTLLALFVMRVVAQIAVVLVHPRWLPPMKDWYSGLLAYPLLLPAQIAIIALMLFMIRQVARGVERNRRIAIGVFVFASLYAAAMLVRFIVLRTHHPEYAWYEGGMIPILFHWVLAGFLFVYARSRLKPPAARIP
ncbi:MAG TPA: hypothetical protein VJZ00_13470 [Thermoanaerobaculia bacterium]|nr:hypothetical protein [Thermoanaerobaculia bacterium]